MNLNPQNESEDDMELRWMEDDAEVDKYFDDIVGQPEPIESCDGEIVEDGDYDEGDCDRCDYDESMDGDFESGMASAGWGTDEDYE
jgi:hypothetical protein